MILNDFIEIDSITVQPMRNDETEGLGSGQVLIAELATPLWSVEINTPLTEFDDGREIRAILNDLSRPGATFEIYDPIAQYPRADPDGSILGAATPQLASIDGDAKPAIKGLPVGYKLSRGDYFQMDVSGRRYFFEVSEPAVANGSGVTPNFKVFPAFPISIPVNTAITLKQPKLKCQFVAGENAYGSAESNTWKMSGFRIKMVQKL
jgi:hypothetical protein